jgi:tRNA threonylcarbamoyladenosine biosynthesis protein TsaB
MIVLGFDTATRATAVALRLGDGETLSRRDDPGPGEHPGHATRLLAMAGELLRGAAVGWSAVERIAVGLGPGTFTGLRVGVATARGLAQSLSAELVGVSSLGALAEAALQDPAVAAEAFGGGVLAVVDARRKEVFAAAYGRGDRGSADELMPAVALAPHKIGSLIERAEEQAGRAEEQAGRAGRRWLAVGDGAVRYRDHLQRAGADVPEDSSRLHLIDAATICRLGLDAPAVAAYEEILPDYRRRPDAELALEALAVHGSSAR